jgi:hypothetical protein
MTREKAPDEVGAETPIDLEAVRKTIKAKVGKQFGVIVDGLIEAAKAGNVTQAKYLFEIIGLYPAKAGEEATNADDTLVTTLLKRLGLPEDAMGETSGDEQEAELAGTTVK